jgi:hypothetical protein
MTDGTSRHVAGKDDREEERERCRRKEALSLREWLKPPPPPEPEPEVKMTAQEYFEMYGLPAQGRA